MADHVVGTMDTSAQEKAYAGFVKITTRSVITIIIGLVLLALING
jgi:hypothetical protein